MRPTSAKVLLAWLCIAVSGACGKSAATNPPGAQGSVLERNNHPSRDGHFVQPLLSRAAVKMAPKTADASFTATFMGNMWASPLYLENGPSGKGTFFAVTTGNDVLALDETDGHLLWRANIGSSPTANGVSCGSIHPLGIISTPVIDATARRIYVAGAIGTTSIARHEVHALSVDDGTDIKTGGWPVDVSKLTAGALAFTPPPYNQRSALSLIKGTLYVAYGGHVGDCGNYHGWVTGIDTRNATLTGSWATGGLGSGIWAAGGMASDGEAIFPTTGNDTMGSQGHVDSEEVVRVTGLAKVDTASPANVFYPARWQAMDGADADMASSSTVYIEVPGATPATFVVAISKDGHLYLLDSKNLGGMDGAAVDFVVAASGMSIHTAPAAYTTAAGVHVLFSTDSGAVCPAGTPAGGGKVIMSVLVPPGAPPAPRIEWCAPLSGAVTSPVVTTTDGKAEAIVWYMNNGKLTGLDGDTGASIYASADTCPGVRQWTSPIAVKGRIIAGADGRLCAWTVH